ncbi:MAG: LLM class flavin-dependent oxidoreductase [Actinomycetota bacterium]
MKRTGTYITAGRSLESAIGHVRLAEDLGYDSVWTSHIASRDSLMLLAAYGQATSRLRLGTGVLPCLPRHPVALAQQAATLDEITGGRLVLGIGPSHKPVVEGWYGMTLGKPLAQMREYVTILRSVLATGSVEFHGEFYSAQFGFLGYSARKDLPIYLAAVSPKMLEMAGEMADGVVLWLTSPAYVRDVVVPHVRAGAERAGRDPATIEIVEAIPSCVSANAQSTIAAMTGDLISYASLPFYRAMLIRSGFGDDLGAFDAALAGGNIGTAMEALRPIASALAAVGSADEVRERIEDYRQAGVSLPCPSPFRAGEGSASPEDTLRAAAP